MSVTRSEVVARALALFGEDLAELALREVDQYGIEPYEREVDRVKLEILDVSEGKLHRLPYFVKCAKIDYRDVLTGARLPPMSETEEAAWIASANRQLEKWSNRS